MQYVQFVEMFEQRSIASDRCHFKLKHCLHKSCKLSVLKYVFTVNFECSLFLNHTS